MLGCGMSRALMSTSSSAQLALKRRSTAPSTHNPLRRSTNPRMQRKTPGTTTTTTPKRQCSTKKPPPSPQSSEGKGLLARYTELLETRPLLTKAITSGIIAGAGDITCQVLAARFMPKESDAAVDDDNSADEKRSTSEALLGVDIDWSRCSRFMFLGTVFLAPALHFWYGYLGRTLAGNSLVTVSKRVVLDQLVFTPFFLASFLASIMIVDGKADQVVPKLSADYAQTLMGNWGYWIPAQLLNFRFVAPAYQVLCANGFGFVWNIYLSFQSNKAVKTEGNAPQKVREPGVTVALAPSSKS